MATIFCKKKNYYETAVLYQYMYNLNIEVYYPYCGSAQPRTTNKIPIVPVNESNIILKLTKVWDLSYKRN